MTAHPIVGVWMVTAPDAPFTHHMFTFHADGTMLQANPEAGNAGTSDSAGMGVWQADGSRVRGRFAETTADRATRAFLGTRLVAFTVDVDTGGDAFAGKAEATFREPDGTGAGRCQLVHVLWIL